jgi:biopolymer transport protein ExbD
MPIYAPGIRDRHNRSRRGRKRNIVAMLPLTAMVDMFTVLAVFLLQNYQTTGEVIELSDDVKLPKASATKELKPANVIMVSPKEITLDKQKVVDVPTVRAQADWDIPILAQAINAKFKAMEEARKLVGIDQIRQAVDQNKPEAQREKPEDLRRVTVQADKSIDFLTIKKVMYTLYQAGASEINFAVLKDEKGKTPK